MSTPDQPLTRKQLRELQRTGSVPVQADTQDEAPEEQPRAAVPPTRPDNPPARAVEEPEHAPSHPDVDLEAPPLTRRQAREQERIRTASVPIISPDSAAADDSPEGAEVDAPAADPGEADRGDASQPATEPADAVAEPKAEAHGQGEPAAEDASFDAPSRADHDDEREATPLAEPVPVATVGPQFGAELLAGDEVAATLPPSFDELIARGGSTTGALSAPSALILSQTPSAPPLSGPVNATGEVIITGSYHLPEGLGSRGGDPRATDGKDVDAVLIDGELPAASSPTPIAASAAVSTVRGSGEIIRPPAPEKSGRLLFTLAITAGVLALALVGVLIIAVVNGAL